MKTFTIVVKGPTRRARYECHAHGIPIFEYRRYDDGNIIAEVEADESVIEEWYTDRAPTKPGALIYRFSVAR